MKSCVPVSVERSDKDKDAEENVDADQISTGRFVKSGQSIGLCTQREEIDIDFRVSGLPHAVAKQAENFRVRELVKKIESHPHRPFWLKPFWLKRVGQVSFCCCFARQKMPRRGRHVSEDLSRAVWQEILRGPRPPAARWPTVQGSRQRQRSQGVRESMQVRQESILGRGFAQGRRGSTGGRQQDGAANPTRQEGRGLPPDEVMANARARVSKLEAAIAAVGDSDPTCATLREALARAKSQAQERPVADRIKHTNIFIERAKKRVHALQEDVKMAQAAVVVAQEKLAKEEVLLRQNWHQERMKLLRH